MSNGNFNAVFRLIITPLFLFSGVFFPITRLPAPFRVLAVLTPLYHGVELTRGLTLNTIEWGAAVAHVAYLAALFGLGFALAVRTFTRKLHA